MNGLGPQVSIRELRRAYGLSAVALAERIRVSHGIEVDPSTLRNVELGHKRASEELMAAWSRALSVSPLAVTQPVLEQAVSR